MVILSQLFITTSIRSFSSQFITLLKFVPQLTVMLSWKDFAILLPSSLVKTIDSSFALWTSSLPSRNTSVKSKESLASNTSSKKTRSPRKRLSMRNSRKKSQSKRKRRQARVPKVRQLGTNHLLRVKGLQRKRPHSTPESSPGLPLIDTPRISLSSFCKAELTVKAPATKSRRLLTSAALRMNQLLRLLINSLPDSLSSRRAKVLPERSSTCINRSFSSNETPKPQNPI